MRLLSVLFSEWVPVHILDHARFEHCTPDMQYDKLNYVSVLSHGKMQVFFASNVNMPRQKCTIKGSDLSAILAIILNKSLLVIMCRYGVSAVANK